MAESKRGFSAEGIPVKQDDYHGSCRYVRTSPDVAANGVKSVNVELSFDESLRLATALQSAIMRLNRYNRASTKGKNMGLCLSLKTDIKSISVIEITVKPATPSAKAD